MKAHGLRRGVLVAVAAAVWAAFIVGSCVTIMTLPVYTSAAEQVLGVPATAGLSRADVIRLSQDVRRLVADSEYAPLPSTWRGEPGFDSAAVSHLLDVRMVMSAARLATGASALLLALFVAASLVPHRFEPLWSSMRWGAVLVVVLVVLAVAAASTNFDAFFAAFHGLFFKAGTWMFPADSLLIRLFPERFWEAAGAVWGALSLIAAGILASAAHLLRTAKHGVGASRTADNV
jgi:integral membrane protein (TIGR01906 family)